MDEFFDFDALLPRALMEANLLQFQGVLDQAEAQEPAFSPHYRRSRLRLMNDPQEWLRRRTRPLWKKALRGAACVFLACTVALGGLMAVSPTVRAAVLHWLREFTEEGVAYRPGEAETGLAPSWRPAWLPEGTCIRDLTALEDRTMWTLENTGPGSDDWSRIRVTCDSPGSGGIDFGFDEYTLQPATVQGAAADFYEYGDAMMLAWESPQGHLLTVELYGTDRTVLERVAESMTFYDGTDVRYEAGWLPEEGAPEITHFENIGVGQFQWFLRHDFLTFQYMADPPCRMSSPDRESEEVTVNGLPARYWPCLLPEEETGGGQTEEVGGVRVTAGIVHGPDQSAVLLWEDPETNTVLQISGVLEREEILRVAESVRAVPIG